MSGNICRFLVLVLNPTTQHISPQYQVIFDDDFTMVPSLNTIEECNKTFKQLFITATEYYIYPDNVEAGQSLLEWLSHVKKHQFATANPPHSHILDSGHIDTFPLSQPLDPEGVSVHDSGVEYPGVATSGASPALRLHTNETHPFLMLPLPVDSAVPEGRSLASAGDLLSAIS